MRAQGYFYSPTVIGDATIDMKIFREETFGPAMPLFRFGEDSEAVQLANNTEYGLAAYFFTKARSSPLLSDNLWGWHIMIILMSLEPCLMLLMMHQPHLLSPGGWLGFFHSLTHLDRPAEMRSKVHVAKGRQITAYGVQTCGTG